MHYNIVSLQMSADSNFSVEFSSDDTPGVSHVLGPTVNGLLSQRRTRAADVEKQVRVLLLLQEQNSLVHCKTTNRNI